MAFVVKTVVLVLAITAATHAQTTGTPGGFNMQDMMSAFLNSGSGTGTTGSLAPPSGTGTTPGTLSSGLSSLTGPSPTGGGDNFASILQNVQTLFDPQGSTPPPYLPAPGTIPPPLAMPALKPGSGVPGPLDMLAGRGASSNMVNGPAGLGSLLSGAGGGGGSQKLAQQKQQQMMQMMILMMMMQGEM